MQQELWKKPWALSSVGLITIAGLFAMPLLAGPPGKPMPDWVNFFGHFHPLILHLPIGVFALILLQETCSIFLRKFFPAERISIFPIFFGAASAVAAVIAGFMLYQGGGEDYAGNEVAERHLWGGIVFSAMAILTLIVKAWTRPAGNPAWYRALLFASVGVMSLASHDGGTLTHGEGFLTKFAPAPLKKILGIKVENDGKKPGGSLAGGGTVAGASAADAPVYAAVIEPILERRCVACHKEGKSKGKLRLDGFEHLIKGGSEGPGVIAGKSAESIIVQRMELPLEDEERMPPKGKPQPEEAELRVVKWWIDSGAAADKSLAALSPPAEIQADITALTGVAASSGGKPTEGGSAAENPGETSGSPHAEGSAETAKKEPDAALKAKVAALAKEFPGSIIFQSEHNDEIAFTAVGVRDVMDDAAFAKFKDVIPHFVYADLAASKISDASVALLKDAKKLKFLRVSETSVTDAALEPISQMKELESLNLFGTQVTDAGIGKLAGIPSLSKLFLWHTAVTPAGIADLQAKLPECEIATGVAN